MLFVELALSYWKKHKKRAFTIILAIILGTAAMFCALLLVRSLKLGELEENMVSLGNYDFAFYVSSEERAEEIEADERFEYFGIIYQLGNASAENGTEFPVGCMEDKKTEEMWHQTPIEGRYPEKSGEIAIDAQTLKAMGYPAKVGEDILLTLRDRKGNPVNQAEFHVVGIIEQTVLDSDSYGSVRSRMSMRGYEEMTMFPDDVSISAPYAYLSKEDSKVYGDCVQRIILANVYLNAEYDDLYIAQEYADRYFENGWTVEDVRFQTNMRPRSSVANYILSYVNNGDHYKDLNTNGMEAVKDRMEEGRGYADAITRVVIPVILGLIILLTLISAYEAIRAALTERTKMMGLLRCLGLTKRQSVVLLFVEIGVMAILAIGIGYLSGAGLYQILRVVLRELYGITLQSAFSMDPYFAPYISAVTWNPFVVPLLLMAGCVLLAIGICSVSSWKFSPIQAYRYQERMGKRKKVRGEKKSAIKVYFSPVRKFSRYAHSGVKGEQLLLFIQVLLIMSSAVSGYTFFRAASDNTNREMQEELENTCLSDCDYFATKTSAAMAGDDMFHGEGITKEEYEKIGKLSMVKNTMAVIEDKNTKLSFSKSELESQKQGLAEYLEVVNYRTLEARAVNYMDTGEYENDLVLALGEMARESYKRMGYAEDEMIYSIPTVAVSESAALELEQYVVAGHLDWDEINSGREAVIVLTEDRAEEVSAWFPIGESLPLSQIIYEDEVDCSMEYLGGEVPEGYEKNHKKYYVKHGQYEQDYYDYGQRKDISVSVGAIIVLDSTKQAELVQNYYCGNVSAGVAPMNFLVGMDALENWKVPDKNYTKVKVNLKENISEKNIELFEKSWYQMMSDKKFLYTASQSEKRKEIYQNSQLIMGIFVLLILLLMVIGILGVSNVFAMQIQNRKRNFALAQLVGGDFAFCVKVMLYRFMPMAVLCGMLSGIPIIIAQKVYDYGMELREQAWEDVEDITYFDSSAWYFNLPIEVDLCQYHLAVTVVLVAIVVTSIFGITLWKEIKKIRGINPVEEVKTEE